MLCIAYPFQTFYGDEESRAIVGRSNKPISYALKLNLAYITIFVNWRLWKVSKYMQMVQSLVQFVIVMTCIYVKLVSATHVNQFI